MNQIYFQLPRLIMKGYINVRNVTKPSIENFLWIVIQKHAKDQKFLRNVSWNIFKLSMKVSCFIKIIFYWIIIIMKKSFCIQTCLCSKKHFKRASHNMQWYMHSYIKLDLLSFKQSKISYFRIHEEKIIRRIRRYRM